jgi:peptidoglycan/xylan/chitin deacetylase (PgdA/CDA1 family)
MTREQAQALAAADGAEVGAHTRTHAMLARQSPARQRDEVLGSIEAVAALTGRPVRAFAYPFGGPADVGPLAPRLAAEGGCLLACATTPGLATRASEPLGLPRLTVGDWDGAEFAARVTAALAR